MKRSRRMLLMSCNETPNDVNIENADDVDKNNLTLSKLLKPQYKPVSPALFTSPTTGHTIQILQNAILSPDPVISPRVKIIESIIVKPGYSETDYINTNPDINNANTKPGCSDIKTDNGNPGFDECELSESHIFSTPKRLKSLKSTQLIKIDVNKGNKMDESSSTLTSRRGSFSDISTSNMVSLNSSFNEEQLFSLLSTPQQKGTSTTSITRELTVTDDFIPQPSTSKVNSKIKEPRHPKNMSQSHLTDIELDDSDSEYIPSNESTNSSSEESSSQESEEDESSSCDLSQPLTEENNYEWQDTFTDDLPCFQEFADTIQISVPSQIHEPYEFFKLFLTDQLIEKMVFETNKYAESNIMRQQNSENSRSRLWKSTDSEEMHKFLGILLVMGLVKLPKLNDYWSKNKIYRNEYIVSLMSRDRFLLILKYWHFSEDTNSNTDKLHKIREVYNMLINKFREVLKPGQVMVIDETMIPWRGRLRFRQYIKNKSHKYGVKLYKACTPEGYTFNVTIYTGKKDDGRREVNHSQQVVLELIKDLEHEGRLVVVDNFYTSIGLAEALIEKKTFICGTLRVNRKDLPKSVISTKLKKGQVVGKINRKGIRVIKWFDKRPVLMLSTCKNHDTTIKCTGKKRRGTNEDIMKPECILTYNKYKKGIDYSDQMSSYYSTLKRGLKWYRKVLMELLFGTALINAWIVYNLKNNTQMSKKLFVESIIENFTKMPLKSMPSIPQSTNNVTDHSFKIGVKKRNCSGCYEKLRQTMTSKEAAKKVKKVKTYCELCEKTQCRQCFNEKYISKVAF